MDEKQELIQWFEDRQWPSTFYRFDWMRTTNLAKTVATTIEDVKTGSEISLELLKKLKKKLEVQ